MSKFIQKKKKTILASQTERIVQKYLNEALDRGTYDRALGNAMRVVEKGWTPIIKVEFVRDQEKGRFDILSNTETVQPWMEDTPLPGVDKDRIVFGFVNAKVRKEGYFISIPVSAVVSRLAKSPAQKEYSFKCNSCSKTMDNPKYCAKCNFVVYCSRECQVAQWKIHKGWCEKFSSKTTTPVETEKKI